MVCGLQCGDRGGQVTETVGPSVVKIQKSSDKFCGTEWSRRRWGGGADEPIALRFLLTHIPEGDYNLGHQSRVDFIQTVRTAVRIALTHELRNNPPLDTVICVLLKDWSILISYTADRKWHWGSLYLYMLDKQSLWPWLPVITCSCCVLTHTDTFIFHERGFGSMGLVLQSECFSSSH